ncbi:aminoglycoside phosphotransferase family protein [Paenibacillus sp. Marseille-Q4541]|uniref:aminoglycoside phosphotransferase family protein n=1 Tax=Paenibacillus sp. Marseille-Q4541 TaxID=2831522 RepID=UPI00201850C9|nr:aminoglycoside phosphotransferase family protein [Paenibacillus sp. Marseille-Q4541]
MRKKELVYLLNDIDWVEKNPLLDTLLTQNVSLTVHPMTQGMEAEVIKLCSEEDSFILKVWNKVSKPNIEFQYQLLSSLYEQGLAVSQPLGWGRTFSVQREQVLLTYDDGGELQNYSEQKMKDIAATLYQIHQVDVEKIRPLELPKYDFIRYFFPDLEKHPDLLQAVTELSSQIEIRQDQLIHGDFHLNNLVEKDGRITVIDWTNGQLGDARYDFAWSLFLKRIYMPSALAEIFSTAYLSLNDIQQEEMYPFEAFACLRWILLHRYAAVPNGSDLLGKAKAIAAHNPYLKDVDIQEQVGS